MNTTSALQSEESFLVATPPRAQPLTVIERARLEWIAEYIREHDGVSPTLQELADGTDVSKVTVFECVKMLEKKGWITRSRSKGRSIRVIERCRHCGRMN